MEEVIEQIKPLVIIEDVNENEAEDLPPLVDAEPETLYEVSRTDRILLTKENYEKLKLHHDSDVVDVRTKETIVENRSLLYTNERFKNSSERINTFLRKHGKIPESLDIKNSSIHGLGVFANQPIKKNTYLGDYQCIIRVAYKTNHNYFMILSNESQEPTMFDASNMLFSNWTRFINHSKEFNVKFVCENYVIRVYSTHNINPGDELVNDFGDNYL